MRKLKSRHAGPSESPGFLLWRVSNAWQRAIRAALAPHGLTHAQFVLLAATGWASANQDAPLTQRLLSDVTGVDAMTTSQVVRTLEKAGLVERTDHATDTRAYALRTTDLGNARVQAALEAVEEADERFFAPLARAGAREMVWQMRKLLGL